MLLDRFFFVLAIALAFSSNASAQRSTLMVQPGYGVNGLHIGMSRTEVRAQLGRDPSTAPSAPFGVRFRGQRVNHFSVNLRANPLGVRVSPVHFFRPDASFGEIVRALADCDRPTLANGWRRASCFGGALIVLGTEQAPFEVGFAVSRPDQGAVVRLVASQRIGPIRMGMTEAEVRRAVTLRPAPTNLYSGQRLNASNTIPYAVRYDSEGRVEAAYINQLYLHGSLSVGGRSFDPWALAQTMVDASLVARWESSGWTRSSTPGVDIRRNNYGMYFGCVRARPTAASTSTRPQQVTPGVGLVGSAQLGMSAHEVAELRIATRPHPQRSAYTIPFNFRYNTNGVLIEIRISVRHLSSPIRLNGHNIHSGTTWRELQTLPTCAHARVSEGGALAECRGFRIGRGSSGDEPDIMIR